LERLRPDFSHPVSITTDPPGASAFARFYCVPDGDWISLGRTPLEGIRYPRGLTRLRLELAGHRSQEDLVWNLGKLLTNAMAPESNTWHYMLRKPGQIPDEMEPVPAGGFPLYMPGL